MNQISPPIRILLVAVIGLCAAYMLFLRPKPEEVTPVAATPAVATPVPAKDPNAKTSSGSGAIVQTAIKRTTDASAQSKVAAGETPGGLAADPATGTATGTGTATATGVPAAGAATSPVTKETLSHLPKDIRGAVAKHKVIVLLFYNNRSSDDRAVRRALSHVHRYGGQVFVAPHWIKSVARYQSITRGVDVEQSPTIVVADRNLKAETLVGYVDEETIDQAVVDAILASGGTLIRSPFVRKLDAICRSGAQKSAALVQPTSAAGYPAFFNGESRISRSMDKKAQAIKAPKRFKGLQRDFAMYTQGTSSLLGWVAANSKSNSAEAIKAYTQRGPEIKQEFIAQQHGSHGLSCF